jgi:plastocyanin
VRPRLVSGAVAAFAAAAVAPPAALAATAKVTMPGTRYTPPRIEIVPGDAVAWTNQDQRTHTVTADDASFDSGGIGIGATYTRTFATAGRFTYHCTIHRFMQGEVDVTALILAASTTQPAVGQAVTLSGRAGAGIATVTLEHAAGATWLADGSVATGADGAFAFVVRPAARTTYRVRGGAATSAAVAIAPVDLRARLVARYRRHAFVLTARVTPAQAGARVVFQRYVPELFAWATFARRRLGAGSTARVTLRVTHRTRVRVVFPAQPGRPGPAASRAIAIGRGNPFG